MLRSGPQRVTARTRVGAPTERQSTAHLCTTITWTQSARAGLPHTTSLVEATVPLVPRCSGTTRMSATARVGRSPQETPLRRRAPASRAQQVSPKVRQKRGSGAAAAKTCACAGAISAPRLRRTAISTLQTRSNWTAIGPSGPLSVQFRTNRTKSPKRTTLIGSSTNTWRRCRFRSQTVLLAVLRVVHSFA